MAKPLKLQLFPWGDRLDLFVFAPVEILVANSDQKVISIGRKVLGI